MKPRVVHAGNRGPFTLDGTRTYLVGDTTVAVIDPGPDEDEHIRALSYALSSAEKVHILLTHGHSDHAGGASRLAASLDVPVYAPEGYLPRSSPSTGGPSVPIQTLHEGDTVRTDEGDLVVLTTPGHSRDHLAFHWPAQGAVFVGDLILGKGETTWVGEYLGCVADYLTSLDKVLALNPSTLYPTHGRPVVDPPATIQRFRTHRLRRLQEVRELREVHPDAGPAELARRIYGGEIPEKLAKAACSSVEAALFHLDQGRGGA